MRSDRPGVSRVMSAVMVLFVSGCSWFTDFKQQPKLDPWETPADTIAMRANPQASVPIYGTAAPGFAYGRLGTIPGLDSMSVIANPVPADQRSLRNGHLQYAINCMVCHGSRGAGDGPLVTGGFGFPPIAIGAGSVAATTRTDGYIFGIIRNGRGLMPPYNRIEEVDRWDLINYLRALQRDSTTPAGELARPGITGDYVPGPSMSAPTRPAPHYRPATAAASAPSPPPGQGAPSAPAPHTP